MFKNYNIRDAFQQRAYKIKQQKTFGIRLSFTAFTSEKRMNYKMEMAFKDDITRLRWF